MTQNLLDNILSNNIADAKPEFQKMLYSKIAPQLDSIKSAVAKQAFNPHKKD